MSNSEPTAIPVDDPPDRSPVGRHEFRLPFGRPRHPWLVALAMVVVVGLVGETYVRSIETQFETLRAGDSSEMILKAQRIHQIGTQNRKIGALFFGNSMMDTAISPNFFVQNSTTIATAYNAAVVGAPLQTRKRWASEIVFPNLDPDLIVLGVHPVDLLHTDFLKLNQDPTQADVIFAGVLRETDSTFGGNLERTVNDRVALVRDRGVLRRPRTVWDATLRRVKGEPKPKEFEVRTQQQWEGWLKEDGEIALFHKQAFKAESVKNTGPKLKENLQVSNYSTVELKSLLDQLTATGKRVVVVIPPVPLAAWKQAGVKIDALRAGNKLITEVAASYNLRVIDFTERDYKNGLFVDVLHTNDLGSLQFSKQLAQELDKPS